MREFLTDVAIGSGLGLSLAMLGAIVAAATGRTMLDGTVIVLGALAVVALCAFAGTFVAWWREFRR